jgi:DNA primase large subunit
LSLKLGPADLAKYPFLDEASNYIRDTTFAIDEFDRPEMDHIVRRAVNRLETEISTGKVYTSLERYEVEILTFIVTLLLVKALDLEPVTRKYSLLEAIRAEKFLTDDLIREKSFSKKKLLLY